MLTTYIFYKSFSLPCFIIFNNVHQTMGNYIFLKYSKICLNSQLKCETFICKEMLFQRLVLNTEDRLSKTQLAPIHTHLTVLNFVKSSWVSEWEQLYVQSSDECLISETLEMEKKLICGYKLHNFKKLRNNII